jgi:ubiquinone/menaquinone biosynthesis C-methylase UbiE
MLGRFVAQFSGPRGALGHVAGWLMARQNVPTNAWVVELLEVGPEDRVVEVGFGPGLALARNAERAAQVAGIDRSELMVAKARRRFATAIRAGRVDLRHGTVEQLPFADQAFTRAMAVNSLQFWPSVEAGLRELRRVLAPGGRLVLAQRLRKAGAGRFDRSRFGMTEERLAALTATLGALGFRDVEVRRRTLADEQVAALCARRGEED